MMAIFFIFSAWHSLFIHLYSDNCQEYRTTIISFRIRKPFPLLHLSSRTDICMASSGFSNSNPSRCIKVRAADFMNVIAIINLIKIRATKTHFGSGGIAPRNPDLGTRRRWVVSFTRRPLYPQGKSSRYPLVVVVVIVIIFIIIDKRNYLSLQISVFFT